LLKLDLSPTVGHEQSGYRPALVVSATEFNGITGFCWIIPVTSSCKGLPNELRLPDGLGATGTLLSSQLRAVDWRARRFNSVGFVPFDFLESVNALVSKVLKMEV
jgi:mRNA interferase MazF